MRVICIKCGKKGSLMTKQTVSKGIKYRYYYVKHLVGKKIKWCYIGKELPEEYQILIDMSTQKGTQNISKSEIAKSSFSNQTRQEKRLMFQTLKKRAGSSVV